MRAAAIFIALANGMVVGSAFVAFTAVLGVIPRLAEVTHTQENTIAYEYSLVLGSFCGSLPLFIYIPAHISSWWLAGVGLFMGMFVGILASALAEVLNVLPILSLRLGLGGYIRFLLLLIIGGKIFGSLVYWLIPGFG